MKNSLNIINSVNCENSANSVNRVNSVNSVCSVYRLLPTSLMVFVDALASFGSMLDTEDPVAVTEDVF